MIRAVKGLPVGERRFVREYEALKEFWQVEPALEGMVGGDFGKVIDGES
jgi:hypothetical protein